jgi:hypothetical protein
MTAYRLYHKRKQQGAQWKKLPAGTEKKISNNTLRAYLTLQLAKLAKTPPEGEEWLFELNTTVQDTWPYTEKGEAKLITRTIRTLNRPF